RLRSSGRQARLARPRGGGSVSDAPKRWLDGGGAGDGEVAGADLLSRSQPYAEPDDLSRERVWRQVQRLRGARAAAPVRRWVWAAALGLLAVVTGGGFVRALWRSEAAARLELTAGQVLAAAPEGRWSGAEAGGILPERSRLKTGPRAQALLRL